MDDFTLRMVFSATVATIIIIAAVASVSQYASRFEKQPMHTSSLSGEQWVQELLHGHEDRIYNELGMRKAVFRQLLAVLRMDAGVQGTRYVSAEEQLATFLHYVHRALPNWALQERFQRSGDTISKSIHRILSALTSKKVYHAYVGLPPDDSPFPEFILRKRTRRKFVPHFNGCLGALDGSHVPVHVPETLRPSYRNRKGEVSQNVLMACTMDMRIVYVLSGWEGSASDSRVFEDAWNSDFRIPPGRYYLGDAGYANSDAVLVPYRGVRYHLKEWGNSSNRPQDHRELFNYRHAQLRNVIERMFGVLKRQFVVLAKAQEYSLVDQARIVSAVAVVHNFICIHDPKDNESVEARIEQAAQKKKGRQPEQSERPERPERPERVAPVDERARATKRRDQIAHAMWRDYRARDDEE